MCKILNITLVTPQLGKVHKVKMLVKEKRILKLKIKRKRDSDGNAFLK